MNKLRVKQFKRLVSQGSKDLADKVNEIVSWINELDEVDLKEHKPKWAKTVETLLPFATQAEKSAVVAFIKQLLKDKITTSDNS